jgi:predicted transcriptional regulator
MAESAVMTLRLAPELRKQLDDLAKTQRRSRSFVASEAIREYLAVNEWQIEEVKKGLQEADRGEFASEDRVRRVLNKWTGQKRSLSPANQKQVRRGLRTKRAV